LFDWLQIIIFEHDKRNLSIVEICDLMQKSNAMN